MAIGINLGSLVVYNNHMSLSRFYNKLFCTLFRIKLFHLSLLIATDHQYSRLNGRSSFYQMKFFRHLPLSPFWVINKQNNKYTLFSFICIKYSITCATNLGR